MQRLIIRSVQARTKREGREKGSAGLMPLMFADLYLIAQSQQLWICSQRGNGLFPTWEHFVPNVGIGSMQGGCFASDTIGERVSHLFLQF